MTDEEESISEELADVTAIAINGLSVKLSGEDVNLLSQTILSTVKEIILLEKEKAWEEALVHLWELADPLYTVVELDEDVDGRDLDVIVYEDIAQGIEENPYQPYE